MALRWIGFLGVVMRAGGAAGEVYFSDSAIELSGSGARASRSCMLVLLPARTLGETAAPRLILLTDGLSRLSFGIANATQYESVELVRNNTRFYGEQRNSGGARFWGKNDLMLCVEYPGPFERVNTPEYTCDKAMLKGFHAINIGPRQHEYTFTMNN
jgi:hypothetical protein